MQNKKLTLEYLFKRGEKLAPGDVYEFGGLDVTVTKSSLDAVNIPQPCDNGRFIKSFAMRKNEGVNACGVKFPVTIKGNNGVLSDMLSHAVNWELTSSKSSNGAYYAILSWKPDIETLTKQQNEESMEKLTSDKIEWEIGDVMAIVRESDNTVLKRFTYNAFYEPLCNEYVVMRDVEVVEVKGVRDAVNYHHADINIYRDHADVDIAEGSIYKAARFGYFPSNISEPDHELVCTIEEFNAEVKAMSHFAGAHAFNDYIEHEHEVLEPEPLAYTQEMFDSGVNPRSGMLCNIVTPCSSLKGCTILFITNTHVVFTDSDGVELCGGLIVYSFEPIETRTPEQIKIQKLSDYLEENKGVPVEELARGIVDEFCGVGL